jgi:hypothetical protein
LAALGPDGSLAPDFAATGLGGGGITPWEDSLFYVGNASIVRRVHLDGTADYGFSMSDPHFTPAQGGDYHVYPDGRVLLTGRHGVNDPTHGFDGLYSLIWFSNTGHYDTTRAPRQTNGAIYRIAPLPNGQFYCGGAFTHYEGVPAYGLVRVQPDGTLDSSFNAHIAWGEPQALHPMADGGVMVGGDFLIEGGTDTLRLMRFLPDGSLDPDFNDSHTFNRTNSNSLTQFSLIANIVELGPDLFAVCGYFNVVDGEVHGGIAMFDGSGNLLENYFQGNGAGAMTYMGATGAAVQGIMPTGDGSGDYWIWGSYHGYDDGSTNDTLQRMVSRLHGLSAGVAERMAPPPGGSLLIRPNPAKNWVEFDYRLPGPVANAYIRVVDVNGHELAQIPITLAMGEPVWDIRDLPKGSYMAVLVNGGKPIVSSKFIVQ